MNTMFSRLDYIDAARRVGDQFVELTSMLPDHDLPLTDNPSLGVHQCVNQVARTPSWLLALATDAASWSGDPAEMPTHDPRAIDSTLTRSIPACVHQLRTDLDVLLDTVKHMSAQVACAVLPDGSKVRCDAALGILIGELLIWGHDIARTVRAPWHIHRDDVPLVARGRHQVLAGWLNPDTCRGHTATYDLRLRGTDERYVYEFTDGKLAVNPPDPRPADAHMRIDPAPALLIAYGRYSTTRAVLTGHAVVWGRRPWLLRSMPAKLRTQIDRNR